MSDYIQYWPIALISAWALLCLYWRRTCADDTLFPPPDDPDYVTGPYRNFWEDRKNP